MKKAFVFIFILLPLLLHTTVYGQAVPHDSSLLQLKKIQEEKNMERMKDSIRMSVLEGELSMLRNPQAKELEKYKKELLQIKHDDSVRVAAQKQRIDSLRNKVVPFKVFLFNEEVFRFYSSLGPFSAAARALQAQSQIKGLYEDKLYQPDSLIIKESQGYFDIVYKNRIITSVSDEDALWEGMSQAELSHKYIRQINKAIAHQYTLHSRQNQLLRWSLSIATGLLFLLVIWLLKRLFQWIVLKVMHSRYFQTSGIRVRSYQLIAPGKFKRLLLRLLRFVRFILVLILLYLALSFVFSLFPETDAWAYKLANWIWVPIKDISVSVYDYLPKLFKIFIVLVIGRYVDKLLRYLSIEVNRRRLKIRGFHIEWATPTYKLLRLFLIMFVLIIVFPLLPGAQTDTFKGVSVFLGVLISLGSSSAVSNTIAGFIITYMRPFQVGDWIKVKEITGEVIEKTALITRLRTLNNEDVTIPNSTILTNETINYSATSPKLGLWIPITLKVKYSVAAETVTELLKKAALMTALVEKEPAPYVLKTVLATTAVSYQLYAFTKRPDQMYFIKSDLNEHILAVFTDAGIDLLTPEFYPYVRK